MPSDALPEVMTTGGSAIETPQADATQADMFAPPVNRAMRTLDRAFFRKKILLAAARVHEHDQIQKCRSYLGADVLKRPACPSVVVDPREQGRPDAKKMILLQPDIQPDDSTWTQKLRELVQQQKVAVSPYELNLSYNNWDYYDIMKSILPVEHGDEIQSSFSVVGHVAHFNLRAHWLPYKHLIAQVTLDKNAGIRTVINKTENVGTHSAYRTFAYELLAGDPSLAVAARSLGCAFRFDYSRVYWNPRLETEHERLVARFRPGEAVCDVMAGVGPFAVPAGKRRVFAFANDLNPSSYEYLRDAIRINKVSDWVSPFNEDGREFIRRSAQLLMEQQHEVRIPTVRPSRRGRTPSPPHVGSKKEKVFTRPKTFQHYVMNLPATAISFLDAFVGLYRGKEHYFAPHTDTQRPMVHVHCFALDRDLYEKAGPEDEICGRITDVLGHEIRPDDEDLHIEEVRKVAPTRVMYCASFRLPGEVIFR